MFHEIVRHLFSTNRPCVFKHCLMHGCSRRRPAVVKLGPTSCIIRAAFWTSTGKISAPDVVERTEAMTGSQIKYSIACRRICTPSAFIVDVNAQTELDECSVGTISDAQCYGSARKLRKTIHAEARSLTIVITKAFIFILACTSSNASRHCKCSSKEKLEAMT